ncbi:MAG: flagellar hook-basal body protein [Planctomycetota bacterium]|jgi:flagellar basal body rod protein FlgG
MSELTALISSRLNGLTNEFNTIAHNLANVSTVGYKRKCNTFSKSLTAQGAGTTAETGDITDLHATFDFSQGSFIETRRSLDFALCGKGFFVIETPKGPLYTRSGIFQLNQNGQITDSAGRIVAGQNPAGPISIPPDAGLSQISVSSDGSISVAGATVGQFKLVDFKDKENELIAAGLNCFHAPKTAVPQPPENLIVKQGFQESSNVQLVEELVDMIMVTRLYEANMKFMSVSKDTSKSLMNVAMG